MKKLLILILSAMPSVAVLAADGITMSVSGMTTKMSSTVNNRPLSININSNGRISSLQYNSNELLSSNGIYFDYTTANGNSLHGLSALLLIRARAAWV